MGHPTYQRIIICDSSDAAARMVAATETDLHRNYLERFPPSVAETERAWFAREQNPPACDGANGGHNNTGEKI
jgi:membrane-bound lytic murein transglycosylase MltF